MQNLALFGVDQDDAGVASALVDASQQIGGSLGIALFSTFAAGATAAAAGPRFESLTAGYSAVSLWAAALAVLTTPIALVLISISRKAFSGTEDQPSMVHLG
jgi:hypothetical protein